jgi:hypothetical protein
MPFLPDTPPRATRAAHILVALFPLSLWAVGIYVAFKLGKAWREPIKVGESFYDSANPRLKIDSKLVGILSRRRTRDECGGHEMNMMFEHDSCMK